MLKLISSYSLKVPASEKFSSQSFLACVEVELPTGQTEQQLRSKIHETFCLVKSSVENELVNHSGRSAENIQRRNQTHETTPMPATPKQLSYIVKLGTQRRKSIGELNRMTMELLGKDDIHKLSIQEASLLVDQLKIAA
jgi:hypothetical protein